MTNGQKKSSQDTSQEQTSRHPDDQSEGGSTGFNQPDATWPPTLTYPSSLEHKTLKHVNQLE